MFIISFFLTVLLLQSINMNNQDKRKEKPDKRFKNVKEKRKTIQKIHNEPSATFLGGLEVLPFAQGTSIKPYYQLGHSKLKQWNQFFVSHPNTMARYEHFSASLGTCDGDQLAQMLNVYQLD
jgi:hypothetical protein